MNLCIDIGNSLIKLALFSRNEMIHFEIIEKGKQDRIIDLVKEKQVKYAVSSSVAEIPEEIYQYLSKRLPLFLILDKDTPIPIENLYESKETLGNDRLAAAIGANYLYPGQNLLVIDAGSAITYDIITNRGQYLGGNISPGYQMRFRALNTFTRRLPLLTPEEEVPDIGKNSFDAIRVGVQKGILYEIDGTIDFYKQQFPDLKVLVTGGDVNYFDNKLKNVIFVVSKLVLIGLNRTLQFNL